MASMIAAIEPDQDVLQYDDLGLMLRYWREKRSEVLHIRLGVGIKLRLLLNAASSAALS